MAHVSIIGTGNMAQAIAGIAGKGDSTVQLIAHEDKATEVRGDIVVLAVPYGAIPEIIAERGPALAGKVVVDITNPLNFETFDSLTVPPTAPPRPSSPPPSRTRASSRRSTLPSPARLPPAPWATTPRPC